MSDITLSAGMRNSLLNLQDTASLLNRTQTRLSSGLKVSSAADDPVAYFKALGHKQIADDLSSLKNGMNEGVSTINAAQHGIDGITKLVAQLQSVATSALNATTSADRSTFSVQYDNLRTQLDNLGKDTSYGGVNLVKAAADTLTVNLNASGTNTIKVTGVASDSAGLAISAGAGVWDSTITFIAQGSAIATAATALTTALTTLRTTAQGFSNAVGTIQTRLDYSTKMMNENSNGANNLTAADTNEESANMLALQTRNSLGVSALSLASQANQAVLKLF